MIWPIPVGDLANTGWRLGQYPRWYIFQDLGRFEVEIGNSKNMGSLRIMPRYGIKNKKNRLGYRSVPLSIPTFPSSVPFPEPCLPVGHKGNSLDVLQMSAGRPTKVRQMSVENPSACPPDYLLLVRQIVRLMSTRLSAGCPMTMS